MRGTQSPGRWDDLAFANLTYNSRYVGSEGFSRAPRGPEAIELLVAAAVCCGLVRLASLGWRDVVAWSFLAWLLAAWLGAQASSRGFAHVLLRRSSRRPSLYSSCPEAR